MGAGTTDRQAWIVGQIEVASDARVLELGCGHGVAGSLLCARLGADGHYVGIDRSARMTEAAGRRLSAEVVAGRARLLTTSVVDAPLEGRYDVVVAIHLPVLDRGDPTAELGVVRRHMQDEGRLHVGFQPLDAAAVDAMVERLGRLLDRAGFAVVDVVRGEPAGRPTAVVTAAPVPRDEP